MHTSLSMLARAGDAQGIKSLLEAGVPVDFIDDDSTKRSPLQEAAREGHIEVVRLLITAGANVSHRDVDGFSPAADAARCRHWEVVHLLEAARERASREPSAAVIVEPRVTLTSAQASHYDAFISYSHNADGALAKLLQRRLEKWAKPWNSWRTANVFLDATSLTATPHLWPTIAASLDQSNHFILLASTRAAKSKWVSREICTWISNGVCDAPEKLQAHQVVRNRVDRLTLVLTEGEIGWSHGVRDFDWSVTTALPPVLRNLPWEPLWIDMRWTRGLDEHQIDVSKSFAPEFLKILSHVKGLSPDVLRDANDREQKKTIRLFRRLLAGLILGLVLATTAGVVAVWQAQVATTNERNARQGAAELAFDRARTLPDQGRNGEAAAWMAKAIDLAPSDSEIVEAARYNISLLLDRAATLQASIELDYAPVALAFHPDGKRLFTSGNGGRLQSWDVKTGRSVSKTIPLDASIERIAVHPNGEIVFCAGTKGVVYRLNSQANSLTEMEPWHGHQGAVLAVAVSPDGKYLATGGADGVLLLRDVDSGVETLRLASAGSGIRSLAFHPDQPRIAVAGYDGTVRVVDWKTSRTITSFTAAPDPVYLAVCYLKANGATYLAAGDFSGRIHVWNEQGEVRELDHRSGPVTALSARPGRSKGEMAAAGYDQLATVSVGLQSLMTLKLLHPQRVESLVWNVTGDLLLTGCPDGARVWRLPPRNPVHVLDPEGLGENERFVIGGCDLSMTGTRTVMSELGRKGRVWVWELMNGEVKPILPPPPQTGGISAAKFDPTGRLLLLGQPQGTLTLWDLDAKTKRWVANLGEGGYVLSVTFSAGGHSWAARLFDNRVVTGSCGSGEYQHVMTSPGRSPSAIAFDDDGKQLVVCWKGAEAADALVTWYDVANGQKVGQSRLLDFPPTALAISKDGNSLLACGLNRSVVALDMRTHELLPRQIPLTGPAKCMAFSLDGKVLLTIRDDDVIELWHWPTCRAVGNQFRGGENMMDIAFTESGKLMIRGLLRNGIVPALYEWPFADANPGGADIQRIVKLATGLEVTDGMQVRSMGTREWTSAAKMRSTK